MTIVFALVVSVAAYVVRFTAEQSPGIESTTDLLVGGMTGEASFVTTSLVSLIAMLMAYTAVVGERDSGSLKILLGLPYSRLDVVTGKFLGRAAVLVSSLLVGFGVGAVLVAGFDHVSWTAYAGFAGLTCALGVAYVGVAVGLSAGLNSRARVVSSVVAVFLFMTVMWDSGLLPRTVTYALTGEFVVVPDWYPYLASLGPNQAYSTAGGALNGRVGRLEVYSLGVLAAWTFLPLALGYLRFSRADV